MNSTDVLPKSTPIKKEVADKIREYLEYAEGLETVEDVKKLVSLEKWDELEKIMATRLTFGTAGLRGKMGPGYKAMNDLVVIQTSQGVAAYLDQIVPQGDDRLQGVVIGFDNRHNSKRFAQLAAVSMLLRNFKVHLYSVMTPTPLVAYAVRKLKCLAGIMVTASHNPKDENGYKVYWSNGAQILPPHDKNIQNSILENLKPWEGALDTSTLDSTPLLEDPFPGIDVTYFKEISQDCSYNIAPASMEGLRITFTALHGVSHDSMVKAFKSINFSNYFPVEEQMAPNPDFPTIYFPNPEEKNCLTLAMETANKNDCGLILALDPDGDRCAVAEKLQSGEWYVYSGNELGTLLGVFLWKTADQECKENPENCCMISSAVSSKILRSIAEKERFKFHETLTGFKWMANLADELVKANKKFIFAFEEAIGYMCGTTAFDKDGIHAAMQVTKMAAHAMADKMNLYDYLKEAYHKYGYHTNRNSYFICHDPVAIKAMFHRLRNFNGVKNEYPKFLDNDPPFPVAGVRDLTTGFDSTQPDNKAVLPCSSSTEMITFYFDNGCEATLRTSGTEPKVKYYTEMIAKVPQVQWTVIDNLLTKMVDLIVAQWIQPETNGFLPRPT